MDKLFGMLTDLTFRRVATPQLVPFLYVFTLILCALQIVMTILGGFSNGMASGLISLVVAPVISLFLICAVRVALETVISFHRSTTYLAELARAQRAEVPVADSESAPPPEF